MKKSKLNKKRKELSKSSYYLYNATIVILASALILITIALYYLLTNNKVEEPKVIEIEKNVCKNSKIEKNENIIFWGDSITEIYPIAEIFDNDKILRQGVSGYTTEDLLEKANDMVYKYNPTKVILLIGTNDISGNISEEKQEETVNNIKKIHHELKKNRPKAKLYIQSIYPVNRSMDKDMVYYRTNEAIQNINKMIKDYCKKEKITYINVYDELIDDDGNFDRNYTYDGLHPSVLGYAKISQVLAPYLYE